MPIPENQDSNIDPKIREIAEAMTELRHEFHRHPQLGFEETHAHKVITELLDEWGLEYETMAETGIVVTIEGKQNTSDKVIGLRADMDALSLSEKSGVEWESENKGKMHACGHDGHMATMLTALSYLKDNPEFDGTVKCVFQPAEEVSDSGARRMVEEGLIENHKIDAMYAFHNWPDIPVGKAAIHTGPVMASSTKFRITLHNKNAHKTTPETATIQTEPIKDADTNFEIILHGKGCHGAMPEQGNNPIPVAFEVGEKLEKLKNKFAETHTDEEIRLNITDIQAGNSATTNVIPDDASLSGTFRTKDLATNKTLASLIEKEAAQIAAEHGMTAKISFPDINTPVIYNSQTGNNPIPAAFEVGRKLGTLKDKFDKSNPGENFILSVCGLGTGDGASNDVILAKASMIGTIRTYNREISDALPDLITKCTNEIADRHNTTVQITFPSPCLPTINDRDKAEISRKALAAAIGDENIILNAEPAMTAEDFAEFSKKVPINYTWIGNSDPDNPDSPHNKSLHNTGYDFNDAIIPIGAQYFVNVVKTELPLKQDHHANNRFDLE